MAMSWSHSRQVCIDNDGRIAAGALAYFYEDGTTTPLTVYQDAALTTPHTFPIVADEHGRWPLVFVPYSVNAFDLTVTTASGSTLWTDEGLDRTDPASGSGGGGGSTVIQTGDYIPSTTSGTRTGFVRANGRTIGSAASGATERANADTEPLYTVLYNENPDEVCPVIGGRGASAAADFAANKPLTVPRTNGRFPLGVDSMGGSSSGLLDGVSITGGIDQVSSYGGANFTTLAEANLPAHTHATDGLSISGGDGNEVVGSLTVDSGGSHSHSATSSQGGHVHQYLYPFQFISVQAGSTPNVWQSTTFASTDAQQPTITTSVATAGDHTHSLSGTLTLPAHDHDLTGTLGSTGSGTAFQSLPAYFTLYWYIKL